MEIKTVIDVHHIHVWSIDGINNYATMHVVANLKDMEKLKKEIKQELKEHRINHTTIEMETASSKCCEEECKIIKANKIHHHHH